MSDQLSPLIVDGHTHMFPPGLGDRADSTGDSRWPSLHIDRSEGGGLSTGRIMRGAELFRPVAQTCWDPAARLAAMDASGVGIQVLSPVPVMLTTWAPVTQAAEFARRQNDALAAIVADAPTRFRWIGTVAFQDADTAVTELERAHSELGMKGIEIGSEFDGRELDDPAFRPIFEAAEALDISIFIHPTDGAGAIRRKGAPHEFGLGMLTDTAMAAGALLFGGVLEQFPKLRVGLSHGCGSLPWSFPRLVRGSTMGTAHASSSTAFDAYLDRMCTLLSRFWADTLVFDPAHLSLLISKVGVDHLFVGSDFPFYPPAWGASHTVIDEAVEAGYCSQTEAREMKCVNGLRFLGEVP